MLQNVTDLFVKSRKYWIIYLIFITITCASTLSAKNFANPNFVVATFALVAVLGVLCIVYYFAIESDAELYKVAFIVILCFGMITALIVPIVDVSDELEHLTRRKSPHRELFFPIGMGE